MVQNAMVWHNWEKLLVNCPPWIMDQLRNNIYTPQEPNEKEMDQILTEEVRKLNAIWNLTCRGYKNQTKVKAAWKEVPTVMSGIDVKNLPETSTWSCSFEKVSWKFVAILQKSTHAEVRFQPNCILHFSNSLLLLICCLFPRLE